MGKSSEKTSNLVFIGPLIGGIFQVYSVTYTSTKSVWQYGWKRRFKKMLRVNDRVAFSGAWQIGGKSGKAFTRERSTYCPRKSYIAAISYSRTYVIFFLRTDKSDFFFFLHL